MKRLFGDKADRGTEPCLLFRDFRSCKKKILRIAFTLEGILHSEDRETWLFRDARTECSCSFLTLLAWYYPISLRLWHFPLWL